ncbi:MAG TPA: hypothetical protein VFS63_09140 [Pseudolabrys sp.]|jgi:hypothetical protein|nr:hypothetical protein [Pseudolabrys sp.]
MVDINTSHDYDQKARRELIEELRPKSPTNTLGGLIPPAPDLLTAVLSTYHIEEAEKKELTDPIDFLQKNYAGQMIWRFILTHPDIDHMRGLKRLNETVGIANFWDIQHTKASPDSFRNESEKEEWLYYKALRAGHFGLFPLFYIRGRPNDARASASPRWLTSVGSPPMNVMEPFSGIDKRPHIFRSSSRKRCCASVGNTPDNGGSDRAARGRQPAQGQHDDLACLPCVQPRQGGH